MSLHGGSDGKESACNAGYLGLIPGSGRFPGEGDGYTLQYSCLENSMDKEAWWVIVKFTLVVSRIQKTLQTVQSYILTCPLNTQSKMDKALKANFKEMKENLIMNHFSPLSAVITDTITPNRSYLSEVKMMT